MKGSLLESRWAPGNHDAYDQYEHPSHSYNKPSYHSVSASHTSRSSNPPSKWQSKPPSHPPRTHSVPAPHTTSSSLPSPNTNNLLPPAEELARFMKIVSRLRWKLPFLAEAYRIATEDTQPSSEAEIMFKIDFFEYYALLERAIVHLLAVFNITVSSAGAGGLPARGRSYNTGGGGTTTTGSYGGGGSGSALSRNGASTLHRYHANVLSALESETSPLTPVLGSGHVFEQLRQAKELRNRWKTADMTTEQLARDPVGNRDSVRPLESYDLEGILSAIFAGLEEGFMRARAHVELCKRPGEEVEEVKEGGWDFMVDAMDWEAV
ncbi:Uncharacterized protein PECH_004313 [Penicillium ucsense]|uniref:Uncharacterized protein n=1 Tax=Penicillium ucsense TaxID=2839758 RepID=A0A8J8WDF5_9EURO|nr:Uncharacterized protein PECM_002695 [Penicillium ucsense]KAF7737198.1 Uncharacterized protein PECH_004313 [Penicillium ucsense]